MEQSSLRALAPPLTVSKQYLLALHPDIHQGCFFHNNCNRIFPYSALCDERQKVSWLPPVTTMAWPPCQHDLSSHFRRHCRRTVPALARQNRSEIAASECSTLGYLDHPTRWSRSRGRKSEEAS